MSFCFSTSAVDSSFKLEFDIQIKFLNQFKFSCAGLRTWFFVQVKGKTSNNYC